MATEKKYNQYYIRFNSWFCNEWCTALTGDNTPYCRLYECSLLKDPIIKRSSKCIYKFGGLND